MSGRTRAMQARQPATRMILLGARSTKVRSPSRLASSASGPSLSATMLTRCPVTLCALAIRKTNCSIPPTFRLLSMWTIASVRVAGAVSGRAAFRSIGISRDCCTGAISSGPIRRQERGDRPKLSFPLYGNVLADLPIDLDLRSQHSRNGPHQHLTPRAFDRFVQLDLDADAVERRLHNLERGDLGKILHQVREHL